MPPPLQLALAWFLWWACPADAATESWLHLASIIPRPVVSRKGPNFGMFADQWGAWLLWYTAISLLLCMLIQAVFRAVTQVVRRFSFQLV